MAQFTTRGPGQTMALGRRLGRALQGGAVVAFTGPLGAGKTTFCRGMAQGLGSTDPVQSPTFAIVNYYRGRVPFAHFDAYRIGSIDDLEAAGFYDYLEGGAVAAVEWSENVAGLLGGDVVRVDIEVMGESERRITIAGAPAMEAAGAGAAGISGTFIEAAPEVPAAAPPAPAGGPVIFAVDSSGKTAGVCVLRGGRVLHEQNLDAGRTHSETLLPLVMAAFEATGLAPAGVDVFAVSAGPGSFTGLRIGMSLVKGLALPANVPAVGVSTLEALARAALYLDPPPGSVIVPALDARRSEVYWAAFEFPTAGPGGVPMRLLPDTAGPAAGMLENDVFSGRNVFFVGDGAEICYNTNDYGPNRSQYHAGALPPIAKGAAFAALQAVQKRPAGPAANLRPHYLRLSQAERERRERLEQEHCLRQ